MLSYIGCGMHLTGWPAKSFSTRIMAVVTTASAVIALLAVLATVEVPEFANASSATGKSDIVEGYERIHITQLFSTDGDRNVLSRFGFLEFDWDLNATGVPGFGSLPKTAPRTASTPTHK